MTMASFAEIQSYAFGPFRVTLLPDGGSVVVPTATFPMSTSADWQARFPGLLNADGQLIVSIGGFLIETGDRKIVLDTGLGPMTIDFPGFGPFMGGRLLHSLRQAGVSPEEVTDVVYSHLHFDHVGWTTREENGQRVLTFPNARHLVGQVEWDFWHNTGAFGGPDPATVTQPLAGIVQFIREEGAEIAPGMKVLFTPGHTPGHLSFELTSGGERLILIVDLLLSVVQFAEPTWYVPFEIDPPTGIATRRRMFEELLRPNTVAADAHFADRVFGRLRRDGDGVVWEPM